MGYNSTNIPPELIALLPVQVQEQVPLYEQTRQPTIRAAIAVCGVIAYAALGLRFWARYLTKQTLGLDDLFTGLAVLFLTASIGLVAYLSVLGAGRHLIVMVLEHIEDFGVLSEVVIASISMYFPIIFCVKASALFLYRRIFLNRRLDIICYAILAFIGCYTLAVVLTITTTCLPLLPPTPELPMTHFGCSIQFMKHVLLVVLIINVVLDAVVICLPLPIIWRLKTTTRNKLQLTALFTLSSLIFIIAILRVIAVGPMTSYDNHWDSVDVQLWSIAESSLSILAVSLPIIRPAVHHIFQRKDGSLRFSRRDTGAAGPSNENSNSGGIQHSRLTFGRSNLKGPSGQQSRGLELLATMSIAGAPTLVDSGLNGSGTRLVESEDGGSMKLQDSRKEALDMLERR